MSNDAQSKALIEITKIREIKDLHPTQEQIDEASQDIDRWHHPERVKDGGLMPPTYACFTCDTIWPCHVAIIAAAYRNRKVEMGRLDTTITALADEPQVGSRVWGAWLAKMREQQRHVAPHLAPTHFEDLPQQDKELDEFIGKYVIWGLLDDLKAMREGTY